MKFRLISTLLVAFMFIASGSSLAASKTFNLKLSHVTSPLLRGEIPHPYQTGLLKFAELVKERTEGAVTIDVYPASQLGGEREAIEAMQLGTLDFSLGGTAVIANFTKNVLVFDLPFLFESKAHARTVLDSEYGSAKMKEWEAVGLVGLSFFENSFFDFFATKAVPNPEDMAGTTIRVMENNIHMLLVKTVGGNPVPMAFSEVATSLQNGTIDGIHTGVVPALDLGILKGMFFTQLDCVYPPIPLIASKRTWDALPEEFRAIIRQAAKDATVFERQYIDDNWDLLLEDAKKAGVTVVTANREAWIAKTVKPIYDDFIGKTVPLSDLEAINSYRVSPPVYVPQ